MTTAAAPWNRNRKADLLRFLRLTSKMTRRPGFFARLAQAFPKENYKQTEGTR